MKKHTKTLKPIGAQGKHAAFARARQCVLFVKNLLIAEILYNSNLQEKELQIMYANLRV